MGALLDMKLVKSLHGLTHSIENWHGTIDLFLVGIGFEVLKSDPCVYIFNGTTTVNQGLTTDDDSTANLPTHGDNMVLAGGNKGALEMLEENLMSGFNMSDLGDVSQVSRDPSHP